jgi:hypothetical protein
MMKALRSRAVGRTARVTSALFVISAGWLLAACGDDDDGAGGPTNTGQSCSAASQCYPGVKDGELLGDAVCLDRVEGGYCTHVCVADADCCAVPGECSGSYSQVCSPYESETDKFCFLSCEDEDWKKTAAVDAEAFCQRYAGPAFHCHSSGGGSENRKVCTP